MQVESDFTIIGTIEKLEAEITGFKYKGPGFYLTAKDTLLLVPVEYKDAWIKDQPKGTLFRAYIYNQPFEKTIYNAIGMAATRSDTRQCYTNPPSNCDICKEAIIESFVDGKTKHNGPWAFMCLKCFATNGLGLGIGLGQLYKKQSDGNFLKIKNRGVNTKTVEELGEDL